MSQRMRPTKGKTSSPPNKTKSTSTHSTTQTNFNLTEISPQSILQLQSLFGNAQVQRMLQTNSPMIMRDSTTKPPSPVKDLKEAEKRFESLLKAQSGEPSTKKKDSTGEAIAKTAEAFFKTEPGKQLKDAMLSRKGLPITLIVYAGALVHLESTGKAPFIPPIPLGDNMTLKVDWKGTFSDPKSVKLSLTFKFGAADKEEEGGKEKDKAAPGLTDDGWAYLKKNHDLIEKWVTKCAFEDYEMAGPDEEEAKKRYYQHVRDGGMWPDATVLGGHIASKIREAGSSAKSIDIQLGAESDWKQLRKRLPNAYFGTLERLKTIVEHVASDLGSEIGSVGQINFYVGGKIVPITISK